MSRQSLRRVSPLDRLGLFYQGCRKAGTEKEVFPGFVRARCGVGVACAATASDNRVTFTSLHFTSGFRELWGNSKATPMELVKRYLSHLLACCLSTGHGKGSGPTAPPLHARKPTVRWRTRSLFGIYFPSVLGCTQPCYVWYTLSFARAVGRGFPLVWYCCTLSLLLPQGMRGLSNPPASWPPNCYWGFRRV